MLDCFSGLAILDNLGVLAVPFPDPQTAAIRYLPRVDQRQHHDEAAFEHYLRANGIPYVAVD
jgi:hypothetical protein